MRSNVKCKLQVRLQLFANLTSIKITFYSPFHFFYQNIQAVLTMAKLPKTLQLTQLIRPQLVCRVHDPECQKNMSGRHKRHLCFSSGFAWLNQDQRSNTAGKKWRLQIRLHLTVTSDNHSITSLCDLVTLKQVLCNSCVSSLKTLNLIIN